MALWLIERRDAIGYNEYVGHVIRAEDEEEARSLASDCTKSDYYNYMEDDYSAYEDYKIWLDPERSVCKLLSENGNSNIILSSFNAG